MGFLSFSSDPLLLITAPEILYRPFQPDEGKNVRLDCIPFEAEKSSPPKPMTTIIFLFISRLSQHICDQRTLPLPKNNALTMIIMNSRPSWCFRYLTIFEVFARPTTVASGLSLLSRLFRSSKGQDNLLGHKQNPKMIILTLVALWMWASAYEPAYSEEVHWLQHLLQCLCYEVELSEGFWQVILFVSHLKAFLKMLQGRIIKHT